MRTTGIVRRIDDLGRIVIPKAIREKTRLDCGTPVEFFFEKNSITIKKIELDGTPTDDLRKILDKYDGEIPPDIVKKINEIADFLE